MTVETFFENFSAGAAEVASSFDNLAMYHRVGGTWTLLDMSAQKIGNIKVKVSDSHPRELRFTIYQAQHLMPIAYDAAVVFTDLNYGGLGAPLFEGFVEEIRPTENFQIDYVARDATAKASSSLYIQSGPSTNTNRYPRAVWNVGEERDPDMPFSRREDVALSQIMDDILSDDVSSMRGDDFLAAPPSPSTAAPFLASEIAAFDYVPQEKIVFESETIGSGLDRVLAGLYPAYAMLFKPGSEHRIWHWYDRTASEAITFTLNDFTGANPVIGMQLDRILDQRWTAVSIFGPEKLTDTSVTVGGATLAANWNAVDQTAFELNGEGTAGTDDVFREWQVVDPAKQRVARSLANEAAIPFPGSFGLGLLRVRVPVLQATFDAGATWELVAPIDIDSINGIVRADQHVYKFIEDPDNPGNQLIVGPDDVQFTFAYYDTPISVRYPVTPGTYEGDAYDDFGVERELRLYDEMLAVGYWFNRPVTTAERQEQYLKLATELHRGNSAPAYLGTVVLLGHDYRFADLNKRVNIAAIDGDGDPVVTGWDSIGAIVTDVEYDFSDYPGETTLTFNGDMAEFVHQDPESAKQILGIRQLDLATQINTTMYASGQTIRYTVETAFHQIDPRTNQIVNANIQIEG